MKIIFSIFSALFFAITTVFAQAPQAFSYQAIANNANGTPVVNGSVKVRISILDNTATGAVLYTETHTKTTNAQGLFNLNIGQGAVTAGTFTGINWAVNPKFVKVELDPAGGTNYTTVGTSQLQSVPYALYAGSAGNAGQWATNANTRLAYNSGDVEIGQNGSGLWLTSPNGTKYKISVNDNGQLSLPTSTTTGNTPAQLYMYGSFNNWDANTALLMTFVQSVGPSQTTYAFKGFKYLTAGTTYKFLPSLGSTTPYGAGSNNSLAINGNAFTVPSDGFYQIEVYYSGTNSTMTLNVAQCSLRPYIQGGGSTINSISYNIGTNTFTTSTDFSFGGNINFGLTTPSNVYIWFDDVSNDNTFEMQSYWDVPVYNIPISAGTHIITYELNFNGTGTYTIN